MSERVFCASVTRRRLLEARSLARSLSEHHPGQRFVVLVVDDPADGATTSSTRWAGHVGDMPARSPGPVSEPFERVTPGQLGLAPRAVHELALCREGDDLAACLLPALVRSLLSDDGVVVALSCEAVLLGPLDELLDTAASGGAVLVPRLLGPLPLDEREPDVPTVVASGAFDPGIVAVGPGSGVFLDFWAATLGSAAASSAAEIAAEQPALDLAPASFGARTLRHPGYGVGYWNAHERRLTWSKEKGFLASGLPLKLVHLQGFDPALPELLCPVAGARPRVLLSEVPALARLCAERAVELVVEDPVLADDLGRPAVDGRFEVTLADGTPLDERMRRLARRALGQPVALAPAPPDPFESSEVAAFHDWLASPDPYDVTAPTLPRYIGEIYSERCDLKWHFARVGTVDMAHFREWVASHGLDESDVAPPLRTAIARTSWWHAPTGVIVAPEGSLRRGVVLAGYLRAESGVGEAARLVLDAMESAQVEVVPIVLGLTPSRQRHPFASSAGASLTPLADRRVNLVWMNADQLPGFASIVGPELFAGRYNVGFWAWETERLPAQLARSAELLDEIWVPSAYVRDAVQPVVDCPVVVFPHPIVAPPVDPLFDVVALGIPDGFRFLLTFDFLSSFARKNPLGLLKAFCTAFAPGEGPVLVLKSVNGDKRPAERERLLLAAGSRPDVVVVDGYLSASERGALIEACDCFVSLHRAEGFGLGLGEAMALGKPVIATRYSGNLEFMDDDTALLVPAVRTRVGPGALPYDANDHWAEPDLRVAAELMRQVATDPEAAAKLGGLARQAVLSQHSTEAASRFVERRLGEIEKLLHKGYVSGAADAVRRML